MGDIEKQIRELERRIERIETMIQPTPLTIPLKTAVYVIAIIVMAYIAADVLYTFIIRA